MPTSAASFALPTFTSNSQLLCSSKQAFLSPQCPSSLSLKLIPKPISVSASFLHLDRASASLPSRFVRNLSLSSDLFEEEEILSDGDVPTYSPDLKLFVGNLPFSVDSSQLAQLFESAGTVEMVEVIYDKFTGRSRGFGFVTMSSAEEVEAATQKFNGYELEGRELRVNSGPPPRRERESSPFRGARGDSGSGNGNRVHVGNLAWGIEHSDLEALFAEQGKVLEARVIYDKGSGRSKGFGFVTYSSAEEVNSAIESLNGVDLGGRPIRVSLADPRQPVRRLF